MDLENDVIMQYGRRTFKAPEGKFTLNEVIHAQRGNFAGYNDCIYNHMAKVVIDSRSYVDKGFVIFRHNKNKPLFTGCVMKFINPKESYWKFNNKSSCQEAWKAYNIPINRNALSECCVGCVTLCLKSDLKLKYPAKLQKLADRIIDSYDD